MLGFHLVPRGGSRVLFFSEGLHRRTRLAEALATGRECKSDVLIFAVEPEDAAALPDLVAAVGSPVTVPFEAHRFWREELDMPQADLGRLSEELAARGISAHPLVRGECIALSAVDAPTGEPPRVDARRTSATHTRASFASP